MSSLFAHTPHGLGRVVAEDVVRGRRSYLIEGAAFKTWVDEADAQIHTAADASADVAPTNAGLADDLPAEGAHLPYDYTPQHYVDEFRGEQNIQPNLVIDPAERLSDSNSVSGDDMEDRDWPGPSDDNFAKSSHRQFHAEMMIPPNMGPQDIFELPPVHGPHGNYGPRHLPTHGSDPGGWHPGMPYGPDAWDDYYQTHHHHYSALVPSEHDLHDVLPDEDRERFAPELGGPRLDPNEEVVFPMSPHKNEEGEKVWSYEVDPYFELNEEHGGTLRDPWRHYHDPMDTQHVKGHGYPRRVAGGPTGTGSFPESVQQELLDRFGIGPNMLEEHLRNYHRMSPKHDDVLGGPDYPGREVVGYRSAGLSDKYIDITADVDHFNDPVQQFRDDPRGYIQRRGYQNSDTHDLRTAEYADLVESDVSIRQAAWNDVRRKAQRLRREGRLDVLDIGDNRILATVHGDNSDYEVMILKGGSYGGLGGSQEITDWHCSCDWGKWAFKRQAMYIGRLCSHGYAAYLEMQSRQMKEVAKQHPYKRADVVGDYKKWTDENYDGNVDIGGVTNFISRPKSDDEKADPPFNSDEVSDLYEYVEDNKNTPPVRNYDLDSYSFDRDKVYKEGEVLRLRPHSMTPDFRFLNSDEDQEEWVDVTEDARRTTGPGQIMGRNWLTQEEFDQHGPAGGAYLQEGWHRSPGHPPGHRQFHEDTGQYGPEYIEARRRYAEDVSVSNGQQEIPKYRDFDGGGELLNDLRDLSAEPQEDDFGNMDERNQEMKDLVEELNEKGYAASPFVASRQFTADGGFMDEGGPSYMDETFAGSGPDPKFWIGSSEDYVQEHEKPRYEDLNDEPDDDEIIKYSEPPKQGPRRQASGLGDISRQLGEALGIPPTHYDGPNDMEDEYGVPTIGGWPEELAQHLHGEPGHEDHAGYDAGYAASGHGGYLEHYDPLAAAENDYQQAGGSGKGGFDDGWMDYAADLPHKYHERGHQHEGKKFPNAKALRRQSDQGKRKRVRDQSLMEYLQPDLDEAERWLEEKGYLPGDNVTPAFNEPREDALARDVYQHPERYHEASADPIANFYKSGSADLIHKGGNNSGGHFSDDAIAGAARGFLRTAGRHFSLAEQRALEDEYHPEGARNLDGLELSGTHYVD